MIKKIKDILFKKVDQTRFSFLVGAVLIGWITGWNATGIAVAEAYIFIAVFDWINENLLVIATNLQKKALKMQANLPIPGKLTDAEIAFVDPNYKSEPNVEEKK